MVLWTEWTSLYEESAYPMMLQGTTLPVNYQGDNKREPTRRIIKPKLRELACFFILPPELISLSFRPVSTGYFSSPETSGN